MAVGLLTAEYAPSALHAIPGSRKAEWVQVAGADARLVEVQAGRVSAGKSSARAIKIKDRAEKCMTCLACSGV